MKIKQTVTIVIATLLVAVGVVGFVAAPVNATCGSVETSIINCDQNGLGTCADGTQITQADQKCVDGTTPVVDIEDTGIWGILVLVVNILTGGVGVLAIMGIIYASILYTTAGGSKEQIEKAKGVIMNVVIGVVAFLLMFSFVNFLVPGGLFN